MMKSGRTKWVLVGLCWLMGTGVLLAYHQYIRAEGVGDCSNGAHGFCESSFDEAASLASAESVADDVMDKRLELKHFRGTSQVPGRDGAGVFLAFDYSVVKNGQIGFLSTAAQQSLEIKNLVVRITGNGGIGSLVGVGGASDSGDGDDGGEDRGAWAIRDIQESLAELLPQLKRFNLGVVTTLEVRGFDIEIGEKGEVGWWHLSGGQARARWDSPVVWLRGRVIFERQHGRIVCNEAYWDPVGGGLHIEGGYSEQTARGKVCGRGRVIDGAFIGSGD